MCSVRSPHTACVTLVAFVRDQPVALALSWYHDNEEQYNFEKFQYCTAQCTVSQLDTSSCLERFFPRRSFLSTNAARDEMH